MALFVLLSSLSLISTIDESTHANFLVGGIQVNEPDHDVWMNALKSSGMNTVSVTVYAKQGDWESDNLWFEDEEASVLREIQTAKKHGVNVVLILRVALDHAYDRNAFFWHGMILPKNEKLLRSWFEKYNRFVKKWAKIAEKEDIQVLAIASEMNAISATQPVDEVPHLYTYYLDSAQQARYKAGVLKHQDRIGKRQQWTQGNNTYPSLEAYLEARQFANGFWATQHSYADQSDRVQKINERSALLNALWTKLIQKTRKSYSGKLTYAANFDNYRDVAFWSQLDFIGINAYFPLRKPGSTLYGDERDLALIKSGWSSVFEEINSFRTAEALLDKPVIFTELGYTNKTRSTLEPWSSFGFSIVGHPEDGELVLWDEEPESFQERTLAVRALREVNEALPSSPLHGILYWKFSTNVNHYGIEPFMVHIGADSKDPLAKELARFAQPAKL